MPLSYFFATVSVSVFLVILTTFIFYEAFHRIWIWLYVIKHRLYVRVIALIFAIFITHIVAVVIYTFVFYGLDQVDGFGTLKGEFDGAFMTYFYYSAATYSSLGVGDIFPTGHLRLLSGIQVINGLILIGWSASFTYLAMQKFWRLRIGRHGRPL